MSEKFATQHYEEVELVYCLGQALVVLVTMLVLGNLHFEIVEVVVEQKVKVEGQNLEKVFVYLVEIKDKDEWAQEQVESECFPGYDLPSIFVAKDGVKHTVETSFINLVSSTIVIIYNNMELEVVDPGTQVDSQTAMAFQVYKKILEDPHFYKWLINQAVMGIFQLDDLQYRSHRLKC